MYRRSLAHAIIAAKEFVKRGDAVLMNLRDSVTITKSKDSGAMVRASMELTRKLADLRNNR